MIQFRFLRAYAVTFRILSRYGFLFVLSRFISKRRAEELYSRTHEQTSQLIVTNILILKGLYIKIGQTLSIMTNFLPATFTQGLEKLQDAVNPHPYNDVEKRFQAEFGKTPQELFATFDKIPLAAASLGQVHVATTADGHKLAVKLQHPGIEAIVTSDLKTIRHIFGIIHFIFPDYGLKSVYKECAQMILKELDFFEEGKNLEKIGANFKDDARYYFPKVRWELTTSKILTVDFVEGIKVTHVDSLKTAGINPHDVAVALIHSYCKQIFIDGIYHADPHPGNIIITPVRSSDGQTTARIAMVDFGATATINPAMKEGIILFVEGLIKKDTKVLSTAMKKMGFIAREENEEAFDKIVEYFYGKIKGVQIDNFRNLNLADFQHLNDILELKKMDISLKELTTTFHVPRDWILLERTLILMMGLVAILDPQLNPVNIVIPYAEEFVLGKDRSVADLIVETSKEIVLSYINLPSELMKTLKKLENGQITINSKSQRDHTSRMVAATHQLTFAALLIFSGCLSYLFAKDGNLDWAHTFKNVSLGLGALLGISLWRNRR